MTDSLLDAEERRRRYCVSELRHGDMGEQATNLLMEKISEDPGILDVDFPSSSEEGEPLFDIKEVNQRGTVLLTTRIGGIEISDIMAARLRSLYVTHHPVSLLTPRYLSDFSRAAFLLMFRYSYVDPNFRRQGFVAPQYFEAIEEAFGKPINLESFSSALNTTVPHYCSLFPDVEGAFGSIGPFFDLKELGEHYLIQVSPPRIGSITKQAVEHCIKLISAAARGGGVYHAVLLTPMAWPDITSLIDRSGFRVWNNVVKRGTLMKYREVVRNTSTIAAPMPRVSVLGTASVSDKTSRMLHAVFSQ